MLGSILTNRSLLLAIFVLMAGAGFLPTLISLQLEGRNTSSFLIGLVGTFYFLGLTVGSLYAYRIIQYVGHIRAFAVFVSVFSASALAYAVHESIYTWTALRFIDGICMAGVFVCLESWLNMRSEPRTRGSVLASYMIALYSGQALGQFFLNLSQTAKPSMPFMAAAILLSLSILPIALTRLESPPIDSRPRLSLASLYRISPLGMVGSAMTGVMLGAFYALGAVYMRQMGADLSTAALFMSVVIFGGVLLQWPIGRLSDRFDRRSVIAAAFAATTVVCVAIAFVPIGHALLVLGGIFGGLTFALYPLCVAHTHDWLAPEDRVGASGSLVLVYSLGAAVGPMLAASAIAIAGPHGFYAFMAVCAMGTFAYSIWRKSVRSAVANEQQEPYMTLPRTTPMAAELDPRTNSDEQ